MTRTENPKPKSQKDFFSVQTTRLYESFEGSNSSLSCSSAKLSLAEMQPVGDLMHFFAIF